MSEYANVVIDVWDDFPTSIPYQNAKGDIIEDLMIFPWEKGCNVHRRKDKKHTC